MAQNSFIAGAVVPSRNATLNSGWETALGVDVGNNYLYMISPYEGIYEVLVVREGIKECYDRRNTEGRRSKTQTILLILLSTIHGFRDNLL